jgi:hypothetical protein
MVLTPLLFGWFVLPKFLQIPNGYAIDVDRDPPAFARPVTTDNMVSIDVAHGRLLHGGTLQLRFDEDNRHFMSSSGSDTTIRLRLQLPFD